jgi:hypothetical protein
VLLVAYCEGEIRAQLVWQASCWLVQSLRQVVLAAVFVVVVVVVDVPDDVLPGTTHDVWQLAACELHIIMQLVVVEVCARCSKLLPFAVPATAKPVSAASTQATLRPRTAVTSLTSTGSISQPRPKRKA